METLLVWEEPINTFKPSDAKWLHFKVFKVPGAKRFGRIIFATIRKNVGRNGQILD